MYLILEMCHNGEMSRYIKNRKKPFSEEEGEIFFLYVFLCIVIMAYSINLIVVKEYLQLPSL